MKSEKGTVYKADICTPAAAGICTVPPWHKKKGRKKLSGCYLHCIEITAEGLHITIQTYPPQNTTHTWPRKCTHYQITIWLNSNPFVKRGDCHGELIRYDAHNVIWITITVLNSQCGGRSEMEFKINSLGDSILVNF